MSKSRKVTSVDEHGAPQEGEVQAVSRRHFLAGVAGTAVAAGLNGSKAFGQTGTQNALNLAKVAVPTSLTVTSENKISALNDGFAPANSRDRQHGIYGVWHDPEEEGPPEWVEYSWSRPVPVSSMAVYWAVDPPRPNAPPGSGAWQMKAPVSYRLLYWNGSDFVPVSNPRGMGVAEDSFNTTTFDEVHTDKVRLEVVPEPTHPAGILEWRVYCTSAPPALPPVVEAGIDRSVVLGGKTYLSGKAIWLQDGSENGVRWTKVSGPGEVTFANAAALVTTATVSAPGDYVIKLTGSGRGEESDSTIQLHAEPAPPSQRLDVVYTTNYSIDSPLWNARAKALIVDWIPHCVAYCERTDIAAGRGDGGIDNFIEAAKANRGQPHARHKGYVFSNAWVHQTVESMCIALMVDAKGDPEVLAAQQHMHGTLDRWIPIILAAQMPDGYLQTAYILADRKDWPERWSPEHRGNHEGYVSGYFIESAINHYTLTGGKDLRLYNGAKKLADCWVANIGPGKKAWFDGHQEMEQALVRFGRFVNDQEGNHRGDAYITLAKFLLDSRRGGSEYDQSHLPPGQQYEAVGHAVRATYFYSGMADIAAETGDRDYQSAVLSLWDNMVNRKYYLTGGIGSGETSEGFGPNYSLRNNSYCESCSGCGLVFFQYKLNLAYHDAKFADLYEQTMYNALLGGMALDGKSFCYTNPLVNTERTLWHVCPCCVGNIPRTLLMMPTWAYVKSKDAVFVNLFVGSRINVGEIAGTKVEMVQKTEYPWKGAVAITVNPEAARTFSVHVRVPNRHTSKLYTETPTLDGLTSFNVNGKAITPDVEKGYAVVTREWRVGDTIELDIPMEAQRVVADERIKVDLGDCAFRYGPLIYSVETADQSNIEQGLGDTPLKTEWRPDLLNGVMVVKGTWKDGSAMTAIPNYARMNRVGPPHEYPGQHEVDYAPGATTSSGAKTASGSSHTATPPIPAILQPAAGAGNTKPARNTAYGRKRRVDSKVWI
ncbi:MAG: glycoside hydrolase family 127 protein [Acidobacteriota bacterium]|nr:glycoside hydrolase family 127 protein [Acidobacteriota bacterium]